MSSSYERGRAAEYRCQQELLADGWESARMAGSHGGADIIAWNETGTRFIQCKTWIKRPASFAKDIAKLRAMRMPPGSQAELWGRKQGQQGWHTKQVVSTTARPSPPATSDESFSPI